MTTENSKRDTEQALRLKCFACQSLDVEAADRIRELEAALAAAKQEVEEAQIINRDLAMLVRRLLRQVPPAAEIHNQAKGYLQRKNLQGSPLRQESV